MYTKNMKERKHYWVLVAILLFIVGWSFLLAHISPSEIVATLGVDNSYLVAFVIAAVGGLSMITATGLYATVLTLAAGGASPVLLGIAAGLGITIGDSLFYYLGTRGHEVLSGQPLAWANRIESWINQQREHMIQIFVYIYTGFTPLPNDVLTAALGLAEYSYRRLLPALLLGNITLMILLAEFSAESGFIQHLLGI